MVSVAGSGAWLGERTRVTLVVPFLGHICLAMWLGFCDRLFTTVNFGATQVSCSAYESIYTW